MDIRNEDLIEADDASGVDCAPAVPGGSPRSPTPGLSAFGVRQVRVDVLAVAVQRLRYGAREPAAVQSALDTLVRALPLRPVGEVDHADAAVMVALDSIDRLFEEHADTTLDGTVHGGLLRQRALLLARVDACPVRALEAAMDDALAVCPDGRDALWDARADFHLRGGRWKEALRCYRTARIYGKPDPIRLWRTAEAAVAAGDATAAMEAFRLLAIPVRLGRGERPRGLAPQRLKVRASLRVPIPGLTGSAHAAGRGHLDLVVEAASPVHGPLLEPVDGELPLRIGDVLIWDRAVELGPRGTTVTRVIGRVPGPP